MNTIEKLINNKKIKLTSARTAILEILTHAKKPLSYEDIKDNISMDKATFYRNISKFEEEEIVNFFESNDKKRYYEIKKNPHAHFICSSCSSVECLKEEQKINLDGYQIDNIIIKGLCPICLQRN